MGRKSTKKTGDLIFSLVNSKKCPNFRGKKMHIYLAYYLKSSCKVNSCTIKIPLIENCSFFFLIVLLQNTCQRAYVTYISGELKNRDSINTSFHYSTETYIILVQRKVYLCLKFHDRCHKYVFLALTQQQLLYFIYMKQS